jgi:hypothetical protein
MQVGKWISWLVCTVENKGLTRGMWRWEVRLGDMCVAGTVHEVTSVDLTFKNRASYI